MNLMKILIKGFLILILAIVPIGFFVADMDPYQFFKSDDVFIEQERFQIPGLARNQVFDTAIIGTSMIENLLDSEVSKILKEDALKLPLNASFVTEQGMIIDMATSHNDIKNIIWNIDYRCINIKYGEFYEKEIEFPKYMYDELKYNDWRYVINHSNLFLSVKKLMYKDSGKDKFNEFKTNLDTLNSWFYWQKFSKKMLIEDYTKFKSGERKLSDNLNMESDKDEIEKVIDKEIVERIKKYSDINFSLTFPPKSILWFRLLDEEGILSKKEYAQLYLLKQVENLDNVDVYNFQNIYDITENFDIYHDLNHFNKSGNDYMIKSISEKKHITNSSKYQEEMKDLKTHIYSNKVEQFLKKQD